jgi:hypothetical protein
VSAPLVVRREDGDALLAVLKSFETLGVPLHAPGDLFYGTDL